MDFWWWPDLQIQWWVSSNIGIYTSKACAENWFFETPMPVNKYILFSVTFAKYLVFWRESIFEDLQLLDFSDEFLDLGFGKLDEPL